MDDVINRQAAIKEVGPNSWAGSRLRRMPSAEVEPVKRGKWMEMGTNADGTHNIKCSECGAGYKTKGHANSILTKAKYKFCPRCGAKMKGVDRD